MLDTGALRLMVYDRTCRGVGPWPGLSYAWRAGGVLYHALGRIDDWRGVASWDEAIDWLLEQSLDRPIAEIQFWGHGTSGCALIDGTRLDAGALAPSHSLFDRLSTLRSRMIPNGSGLWWFRTCETFGAKAGSDFARAWTRFFQCRAAGHTCVIGAIQRGLHVLAPDREPDWSGSGRTITFLHGEP